MLCSHVTTTVHNDDEDDIKKPTSLELCMRKEGTKQNVCGGLTGAVFHVPELPVRYVCRKCSCMVLIQVSSVQATYCTLVIQTELVTTGDNFYTKLPEREVHTCRITTSHVSKIEPLALQGNLTTSI